MDYSELLKHPYWQKKRLKILDRDEWKCTRCTDQFTNLQVHHLYYTPDTLPWDYPDDALKTLCDLCHQKAEFIKWICSIGVELLLKKGFLKSDVSEIRSTVIRRAELNMHRESSLQYMDDIKRLING
jgi:hypothetical protein